MTTLEEFLQYCETVSCSEAEYKNYIDENMSDFVQFYHNSWKDLFDAVMNVKYSINKLTLEEIAENGNLLELEIAEALLFNQAINNNNRNGSTSDDDNNDDEDEDDNSLSDSTDDEGEMQMFLTSNNKFKNTIDIKKYDIPKSLIGDINDETEEYLEEIMNVLFRNEKIEKQTNGITSNDLSPKMYTILSDWLVDVSKNYKLAKDTTSLSQYLLKYCLCDDDFSDLKRDKLQLVGATCLYIAGKVEEIYAPKINDFVRMCDRAYTKPEFEKMEQRILKTLQFHVNFVTPFSFLRIFSRFMGNSSETHTLAGYIAQSGLEDMYIIQTFLPSEIAAASIYLAKKSQNETFGWNEKLMRISYSEAQRIAIFLMSKIEYLKENKYNALVRFYGTDKMLNVSKIPLKLN